MSQIDDSVPGPGEIWRIVKYHDTDLYRGNGKPGLTTRMALVEDVTEKISDNLTWIVRLTVASVLAACGSIITAVILVILKVHG